MNNINLQNALDFLIEEEKKASEQWADATMRLRIEENKLNNLPKVSEEDQKLLNEVEERIKRATKKTKNEQKKIEIQSGVLSELNEEEQKAVNNAKDKENLGVTIEMIKGRLKEVDTNLEQIVKLKEEVEKEIK